jgi:hypothetical protein
MMRMAEPEIDIHFDPFPPFGGDLLRFDLQVLLGDERIQQALSLPVKIRLHLGEFLDDGFDAMPALGAGQVSIDQLHLVF